MSTFEAKETTPSASSVEVTGTETDYSHPMFSSDEFMMYFYKVSIGHHSQGFHFITSSSNLQVHPCGKTYRHDWRVCPFAHVGETAARRHPKYYPYVGVICPETKKARNPTPYWKMNILDCIVLCRVRSVLEAKTVLALTAYSNTGCIPQGMSSVVLEGG